MSIFLLAVRLSNGTLSLQWRGDDSGAGESPGLFIRAWCAARLFQMTTYMLDSVAHSQLDLQDQAGLLSRFEMKLGVLALHISDSAMQL